MKFSQKHGFTLVELIVVVTILSILATLGYVGFDTYFSKSRDAKRIGDFKEIANVLEVYYVQNTQYPEPSNGIDVTYSGSLLAWTQGTFGKEVSIETRAFGSQLPVDPLFENEYTYSVTNEKREYQLGTILEQIEAEEGLGDLASTTFPAISSVTAASLPTAYIIGDYNGFMVRASDGVENYFIATPSIISSDINNPDIIHILESRSLVYNEFFNLPHTYAPFLDVDGGFDFNVVDPLIFSGALDSLKTEQNLLDFDSKLKYIYATTPTESFDKYLFILNQESLTNLKSFLTRRFKVYFRSYFNCKDILDDGGSNGDGNYMIDPDGDGGGEPYNVYCDMTTDGGGWTRVGDNQLVNGNFASGSGVLGADAHTGLTHEIVPLSPPVDGNEYALHQTGNYSSHYKVSLADPSLLKPGYEVRMSLWRSDYGSGAEINANTVLMGGKNTPWTLGTCTSGASCFFQNFNRKMAHAPNFGPGGNLTDINIAVKNPVSTITNSYLDGGVLFDGFIPSGTSSRTVSAGGNNYTIAPYTQAELNTINEWVLAGGFLISTNNESAWDPIGEYYNMPTVQYNDGRGVLWDVQNIDHPLVNGSIGLEVDLRGRSLVGTYAHAALGGPVFPGDVVLARDRYAPHAPTVLLRQHGKGYILFVSDDGVFVQMNNANTFDPNDYETVFAAAIMTYAIETAAGINPKEGYVFHNRIHYNDGTFSTNGEDVVLETLTIDDNGTPRIWLREQVRHKVYKTPESFDWYIGLDANNKKDLYYTGLKLEIFYR